MTGYRTVKDSMGELQIPKEALYGAQTQRAINNFPVSGQVMPEVFIRALINIKASAAIANVQLGCVSEAISDAIVKACDQLLLSPDIMQHFPVDMFQTGSGTSSNMNANEVIATLASKLVDEPIDANDHVNFGQSSNDVIPSAIHASAALQLSGLLMPALSHLVVAIEEKAKSIAVYCKTGRTHLMDAMPVTMDQPLLGWASQIRTHIDKLREFQPQIQMLAQGGTAVGTGINTHPEFADHFCQALSARTELRFQPASNYFALIGSQDTAVALSGLLKAIAVTMMKIANDLRWMNSGPLAGLGEISLPALQPGSSIMPGKVNPVIPESAAMAAAQVIGNDAAITIGGQSGNFELNVMLPMIAGNLLNSINILANSCRLLADKAISGFVVNEQKLNEALHKNPILVTALNPVIGYAKAAEIAKQAYSQGRPIIDVAEEKTDLSHDDLLRLLDPKKLADGGL